MTTYLGKSCSLDLPWVSFVYQFMCVYFFPFWFRGMWDLIVLVPDHCLSFLPRFFLDEEAFHNSSILKEKNLPLG